MELKIYSILSICLVLTAPLVQADDFEQASITASATVIPMTGIVPALDNFQALTIPEKIDSKFLIQTPKNSELFMSLTNSNNSNYEYIILSSEQSILHNYNNSVIDIIPDNLLKILTKENSLDIITITRIDN